MNIFHIYAYFSNEHLQFFHKFKFPKLHIVWKSKT